MTLNEEQSESLACYAGTRPVATIAQELTTTEQHIVVLCCGIETSSIHDLIVALEHPQLTFLANKSWFQWIQSFEKTDNGKTLYLHHLIKRLPIAVDLFIDNYRAGITFGQLPFYPWEKILTQLTKETPWHRQDKNATMMQYARDHQGRESNPDAGKIVGLSDFITTSSLQRLTKKGNTVFLPNESKPVFLPTIRAVP